MTASGFTIVRNLPDQRFDATTTVRQGVLYTVAMELRTDCHRRSSQMPCQNVLQCICASVPVCCRMQSVCRPCGNTDFRHARFDCVCEKFFTNADETPERSATCRRMQKRLSHDEKCGRSTNQENRFSWRTRRYGRTVFGTSCLTVRTSIRVTAHVRSGA